MSSKAFGAVLQGLQTVTIEVEVDQTDGIPTLVIIGLATHAVAEAKERITTALASCHLRLKTKRTVVNLAPTDLKKSSPGLDLAIMAALLKQNGIISATLDKSLFLGEIALDGRIKPIRGVLPLVLSAAKNGFSTVYLPLANLAAVSSISSVKLIPCSTLTEVLTALSGQKKYLKTLFPSSKLATSNVAKKQNPFDSIIGQGVAKRVLQIAASGKHHVLMIGPPGSGKTQLAKALAHILPPLTLKESLETSAIHSITQLDATLLSERPFRSPHHSISAVGLLGGGVELLPGEISLAHNGVLFLDELPEFNRAALEAIRQPVEEGRITISRAHGSVQYPANFMLIAACNPCPCGFFGSTTIQCKCSENTRQRYLQKVSGPLLDRFDLAIWVEPSSNLTQKNQETSSDAQILPTSMIQLQTLHELKKLVEPTAIPILAAAEKKLQLSARSLLKVLRVGHTIARMATKKTITKTHLLEALQYRWRYNSAH